jgi:hypothetical protein
LTNNLLKLKITEPLDYNYDLPTEEITRPAMCPPMIPLKLDIHQGYPQVIRLEASGDSRLGGVDVTVQDVLRAIHKGLRIPFPRGVICKLGVEERARIYAAFKERRKSEEELSKGSRRIDRFSRNRLQILP